MSVETGQGSPIQGRIGTGASPLKPPNKEKQLTTSEQKTDNLNPVETKSTTKTSSKKIPIKSLTRSHSETVSKLDHKTVTTDVLTTNKEIKTEKNQKNIERTKHIVLDEMQTLKQQIFKKEFELKQSEMIMQGAEKLLSNPPPNTTNEEMQIAKKIVDQHKPLIDEKKKLLSNLNFAHQMLEAEVKFIDLQMAPPDKQESTPEVKTEKSSFVKKIHAKLLRSKDKSAPTSETSQHEKVNQVAQEQLAKIKHVRVQKSIATWKRVIRKLNIAMYAGGIINKFSVLRGALRSWDPVRLLSGKHVSFEKIGGEHLQLKDKYNNTIDATYLEASSLASKLEDFGGKRVNFKSNITSFELYKTEKVQVELSNEKNFECLKIDMEALVKHDGDIQPIEVGR